MVPNLSRKNLNLCAILFGDNGGMAKDYPAAAPGWGAAA
jgi:hypothetical protein